MILEDFPELVSALCDTCRSFGDRGWCRATSGNFSARLDEAHCLITQSGRQKSRLTNDDLMICTLDGAPLDDGCRPSAEMPLHNCLYRLDSTIGAVLHTHSVYSSLLSRHSGDMLTVSGFEMQKALAGVTTHEAALPIQIFENQQDMISLAGAVRDAWDQLRVPGFLIAGHGLYAWGASIAQAERHIEGFEFLFECLWHERIAGLA